MNIPPTLAQAVTPDIPFRPFLDPLPLHEHWWVFLLPLALGVSLVYKAVQGRSADDLHLGQYARAVLVMTVQIVVGMAALALASYLLLVVYARFIAERLAG
jgi:hypothetical protein